MGEVQATKRATMNKLHERIKVQHGSRPASQKTVVPQFEFPRRSRMD
jgi:hypothetical protein